LISIRDNASDPAANHLAHKLSQAQFQACDFLTGRSWPQLGGRTELLDVIGLNYYPPNQWTLGESPIGPGNPLYRPLSDLLTQVYARYGKPVFLAETGAEGDARAAWFTEVTAEVLRARSRGVPVEGICLYPILNHVGWDDDRICPNGLLGHEPRPGGRTVHQPLADALLMARLQFDPSLSRQPLHA
jgi:polysaccharide biosynthesis protein PelF